MRHGNFHVVYQQGRRKGGEWGGTDSFISGGNGAVVPFYKSITGNFMVYQDRIETNFLQLHRNFRMVF